MATSGTSDTKPYGVIYKIINTSTGGIYIGQTTTKVRSRVVKHFSDARNGKDTILCHAIRKYGKEAFEVVVLMECGSREELDAAEIGLIKELVPRYNSCAGGGGLGSPAPEVRLKISQSMKNREFTEAHRHRISEGLRGRKLPPESLAKIQKALSSRYEKMRGERMAKYGTLKRVRNVRPYISPHSEFYLKVGAHSPSDKISAIAKIQYATGARKKLRGADNPMYGRKISEEMRQRMSEHMKGERNPYFGRKHPPEVLEKMSDAHAKRAKLNCPHCNKVGSVANMKRWHFDNCRISL
jgi:group I intron endonuclease